ncbi:unnamed protein product [Didymodactylos carnosus]|nr:unnamed protein product [Didymodactylos carnosus]CAF4154473.1 unnamed protein product [Didymodactylos carnosus]
MFENGNYRRRKRRPKQAIHSQISSLSNSTVESSTSTPSGGGGGGTNNYLLRQSTDSDSNSSLKEEEDSPTPSTSTIFQNSYEQFNRNDNYSYLKIDQPSLNDYYIQKSNLKQLDTTKTGDSDLKSKCLKRTRSNSSNDTVIKKQKKTSKFSIETLIGKDDAIIQKNSTINNHYMTKIPKALENIPIPPVDKSSSSSSSPLSISPPYSISRNFPYGLSSLRSSTMACRYNPYTAVMAAATGNYSILNGLALTSPTLYNAITTVNDTLYDSNYAKL